MSAQAPGAFAPVLRAVADGLSLPVSDRVRILRELAGDLEALTERMVAEGMAIDEARRRSEEALVPDAQTLHDLARLHQPLYLRLTRSVDPARLRAFERWALAAATLFVVAVSSLALLNAGLPGGVSRFQWPVIGLGAVIFAATVAKAFELLVKRDDRSAEYRLGGLLVLAILPLGTSLAGVAADLYLLAATLEIQPELVEQLTTAWLFADTMLLATGTVMTLAGGLCWFLLTQWVSHIENQQCEVLGITGAPADQQGV